MQRAHALRRSPLVLMLTMTACTGSISNTSGGSDLANASDDTGAVGSDAQNGNGAGHNGGSATNGGGATASDGQRNSQIDFTCANSSAPDPGPADLVRLTATQYQNTLSDLFAGIAIPAPSLPTEVVANGFINDAQGQSSSLAYVTAAETEALAIADTAGKSPAFVGCSPTSATAEDACAATFIPGFGKRVFRHPLSSSESASLTALYNKAKPAQGFTGAITTVIAAMLQAPQFLYRPEIPSSASGGRSPLSQYEIATRLSYLLIDSMPDATLTQAADANQLSTPDQIKAQAQRLLSSTRARAAIADFNHQWLTFDKLGLQSDNKDVKTFPTYNATMAAAFRQSNDAFVDQVFWNQGHLSDLLTLPKGFVNTSLAPLYGLTAKNTDLQLVDLDPSQRGGLLTQVGVMAGLGHPTEGDPVHRGIFVLNNFMCAPPPPPPANVNTSLAPIPDGQKQTLRQRMQATHELGSCKGCHQVIDGIGFGFENFDSLGRYRTTDDTLPVDASVNVIGSYDFDGAYKNGLELAKKLASSEQVAQCVVQKWFSYTLERPELPQDGCFINPLTNHFIASAGDFKGLITDLVTTDAFRFRRAAD